MATDFPTSKQTFVNPISSNSLADPSHSTQHATENDTIEAIQDKLGVTDSDPAENKILRGDGANSSQWDLDFKDEDDMSSDSDTALASQQSIKAYVDAVLEAIYPVGSIFVSGSDTMPALIDGLGTWARIEGRVIVGASDTDGDFDNGDTGGEKTHTLTEAELASHDHSVNPPATNTDNDTHTHTASTNGSFVTEGSGTSASIPITGGSYIKGASLDNDTHNHSVNIAAFNSATAGSGDAHNNLPPYKARYMWERTA